jgi:hypothetical protein
MTPIVSLFLWCSPFAIAWLIIAVVIYSMDAVSFRGSASHVSKKVQIRIEPTLANLDSASTIVRILKIIPVSASVLNVCPASIFRGANSIVTFAMNSLAKIWDRNTLPMITSTRLTLPFNKHPGSNRFFIAAFASASPETTAYGARKVLFNDDPSSKNASCKFLHWSHKSLYHIWPIS